MKKWMGLVVFIGISTLTIFGYQNCAQQGFETGKLESSLEMELTGAESFEKVVPRSQSNESRFMDGISGATVNNISTLSVEAAATLVSKAIQGLGFASGDEKAPRSGDEFLVTDYYIAWIDQTGFYGKLNGFWLLNGAGQFSHHDGERVVNFLINGEKGQGEWSSSQIFELIQAPTGARYGLFEADTPSCVGKAMKWSQVQSPVRVENLEDRLVVTYEGRLVQVDGVSAQCGLDFAFEDGVRRRVYVQRIYVFHKGSLNIDLAYRFRNGADRDFGGNVAALESVLPVTTHLIAQKQNYQAKYELDGEAELAFAFPVSGNSFSPVYVQRLDFSEGSLSASSVMGEMTSSQLLNSPAASRPIAREISPSPSPAPFQPSASPSSPGAPRPTPPTPSAPRPTPPRPNPPAPISPTVVPSPNPVPPRPSPPRPPPMPQPPAPRPVEPAGN